MQAIAAGCDGVLMCSGDQDDAGRGARSAGPRRRGRSAAAASASRTRWRASGGPRSGSSPRQRPRSAAPARRFAQAARPRRAPGAIADRDGDGSPERRCAQAARARAPAIAIAVVAPASPFPREEFDAASPSCARSASIPSTTRRVFARDGYVAGPPAAARGGVDAGLARPVDRGAHRRPRRLRQRPAAAAARPRRDRAGTPKAFIGYSDNTSLLTWLTLQLRHRRLPRADARGPPRARRAGYDATFRALPVPAAPIGRDLAPAARGASARRGAPACCSAAR